MAKLKILLAVHPRFRPDLRTTGPGTERDVWLALRRLGAEVQVLGVRDDLRHADRVLAEFKPRLVFNLLEEFRDEAVYDFHLISFLEALGIPYTGCNPRGLILSRNKLQLASWASSAVAVPKGELLGADVARTARRVGAFPLFVKLNREHASLGIRASNCVRTLHQLRQTCGRLKRDYSGQVLVQEFIPGSDVSVSVWGNHGPRVFGPRCLSLGGAGRVATARLKFSRSLQRQWSARSRAYQGPAAAKLKTETGRLFQTLDLSGYARFDYRLTEADVPYLIDVNANPNLARTEDFALSARSEGFSYTDVVAEVLRLGLNYRPRT